jgi:hypothetical protein
MLMARFTTKSKMLIKEMIILTMLLWDILPIMKILIIGVYLNWSDFCFALQRSPVQVLQISGPLEAYMIVNFRVSGD